LQSSIKNDQNHIMKYRHLGDTDIWVSEVGFGAWGIGGATPGPTSYGPTDDDNSRKALNCAFEKGITFYDTSSVYGEGHSEILIGETFKEIRDRVIIATKAGLYKYGQPADFSPDHLKSSLETSLTRLQTDYIDLFQLHSPPLTTILENHGILNLVEELKKQGKIRSFGVSVQSPEDGLKTCEHLQPDAIQTNFNLLDHRVLDCGFLEQAEKYKTAIIARTPLCFGFLSGKFNSNAHFDDLDHRSRWPKKQIERWVEGSRKMLACKSGLSDQTDIQYALRFCLSFPEITSVIPGMLLEEEVLENTASSELGPLGVSELRAVKTIYAEWCSNNKRDDFEIARAQDPGRVNCK